MHMHRLLYVHVHLHVQIHMDMQYMCNMFIHCVNVYGYIRCKSFLRNIIDLASTQSISKWEALIKKYLQTIQY